MITESRFPLRSPASDSIASSRSIIDCSRSDAAAVVAAGGVRLDGEPFSVGKARVREGQVVVIDESLVPSIPLPEADATRAVQGCARRRRSDRRRQAGRSRRAPRCGQPIGHARQRVARSLSGDRRSWRSASPRDRSSSRHRHVGACSPSLARSARITRSLLRSRPTTSVVCTERWCGVTPTIRTA